MNNARVYRHGLVTDTERVRIPEGDIKPVPFQPEPQSEPQPEPKPEYQLQPEPKPEILPVIEEPFDDEPAAGATPEPEPVPEQELSDVQESPPEPEAAEPNFEPLDPRTAFTVIKADPVVSSPPSAPKPLTKEELAVVYEKELDELKQAVAQEAAQAAAERAYYDALKQKKSELRECVDNVQRTLDELISAQNVFLVEYLNELKFMAIEIAERMILEKISEDDLILEKLILQSIRNTKTAEWINVELSEKLVQLVDVVKKELESPEYRGRTSVVTVPGGADTFRIVTNEGALVGSITVQAENLRRAFKEAEKD